jgi:hypothetical protein
MMNQLMAYVFTSSNPNVIGISMLEDGANLPPLAHCPGPWSFSKAVPFTEGDLRTVAPNTTLAIANLQTRGYHTICTTAVLDFPQPHRQGS